MSAFSRSLRAVLVAALLAALLVEGYYIMLLRERIARQTDELKDISVQLQILKMKRDGLEEELTSARKTLQEGIEGSNGNSQARQP